MAKPSEIDKKQKFKKFKRIYYSHQCGRAVTKTEHEKLKQTLSQSGGFYKYSETFPLVKDLTEPSHLVTKNKL